MILLEDIDKIAKPFANAVVTIGNFDGVHKGHQALFRQVRAKARELEGTSVVMTFEPHPLRVLKKNGPPLITRRDQKLELISASGVDVVLCIPFTKAFAAVSARDFVEKVLVRTIGMKAMVVGPDYSFGRDREGDISLLRRMGEELGFDVIIPDWIIDSTEDADRISSTRIRDLVMEGKVDEAPELLGRYYQIRGKVIRGRERGGSQLGFPTANIKLHDELCPKMGVYAVTVETVAGKYQGVANIGYSPTFDDHIFTIEVHILDFDATIYDTRIRVNLVKRLRDEKKFGSIGELADQIRRDIADARAILTAEDKVS